MRIINQLTGHNLDAKNLRSLFFLQVRQRDAQSTTLMLVVVIGVFLCTEIPLMVITALHTLSNRFLVICNHTSSSNGAFFSFYTFLDYDVAKNIVLIINALICLSYPVNFAIYCGMSRWCNVVPVKIVRVDKSKIIS